MTRGLCIVVAAGTALRLVLAFTTVGVAYDMASYELVATIVVDDPMGLYDTGRWPYPPTYLLWVVPASELAQLTGIPLHSLVQLPAIAADAVIAWLVHRYLLARGHDERRALAGAALVAFGPSFLGISGYAGQFDSVAVLPALFALVLWERGPSDRRALQAGLLIGLAASLKTPMGLMLLALLPTADLRQALRLVVCAISAPLMTLAPFLVGNFDGVLAALRYNGVLGIGGIGLLVQPNLAEDRLFAYSEATVRLDGLAPYVTLAAVLCAGAYLIRRRTPPITAATVLWLTFYVFGINFAFQYLVWGMPVFLLAGGFGWVLVAQLVAAVAALIEYLSTGPRPVLDLPYLIAVTLLLVGAAVALAVSLRRLREAGAPPRTARGP